MMAARSRIATIGCVRSVSRYNRPIDLATHRTPASTFSGFAAGTLHRIYAAEADPEPPAPAHDEAGAADEDEV
jgi:hypothetical protein